MVVDVRGPAGRRTTPESGKVRRHYAAMAGQIWPHLGPVDRRAPEAMDQQHEAALTAKIEAMKWSIELHSEPSHMPRLPRCEPNDQKATTCRIAEVIESAFGR